MEKKSLQNSDGQNISGLNIILKKKKISDLNNFLDIPLEHVEVSSETKS